MDVIRVIGTGSMGEVCFARDKELMRDVAFKRLRREASGPDDPMVQMLEREARIGAQLDHPNIIPVHRFQRGPGNEFGYVMKLVQGETLQHLLSRARDHHISGQLESDEVQSARLEIMLRVIDAVAYAHDKGVVHRDLKPANVLIAQRGQVYLTDWGLARVLKRRGPLANLSTVQTSTNPSQEPTEASALLGTVRYMSPEQANGRTTGLGPESDVFGLGVMLYEVLLLQHPYPDDKVTDMMQRVRAGKLQPRGPDRVDEELLDVAAKATATRPEDRYPNAGALADDLLRWRRGVATEAGQNTPMQRVRRLLRRRPDVGMGVVLVLLLIDLFVLLVVLGRLG